MSATSEEHRLYAASRTIGVFLSFDELKRILPDRILLSRIDDIFRSWCEKEAKLPSDKCFVCDQLDEKRQHILYEYDHYEYLSAAFPINFLDRKSQYCIKLANNGFIYPSASTLETDPSYNDSFTYHGTMIRGGVASLQRHCTSISRRSSSLPISFSKGHLSMGKFYTTTSKNVLIFDSKLVMRQKTL